MRVLTLAIAFGLSAGPALAESPCAPTVGGRHEPAFLGAASEDLDFQTRCLIWEYAVQPKAEFLPGYERPEVRVRRVQAPPPSRAASPEPFADLFAGSLRLRPADSTATPLSVK